MSSSPFISSACPTYDKSISSLQSSGYIDATTNLVAKYDAATAHLGAPWRMPTDDEIGALVSNCTTIWTTRNGMYGRLVTGKDDYATKSIFLPAAGNVYETRLEYPGTYGACWSSTPLSDDRSRARDLGFHSSYFSRHTNLRYCGQQIRPIRSMGFGYAAVCNAAVEFDFDNRTNPRETDEPESIGYSNFNWGKSDDVQRNAENERGLLHRWSFNGSLTDSAGRAGAEASGAVSLSDTQCVLEGGSHGHSAVSLGGDVFKGVTDGATIEIWATQNVVQNWSRVLEIDGTPDIDDLFLSWTYESDVERGGANIRETGCGDIEFGKYELGKEFYIAVVFKKQEDGSWLIVFTQRDSVSGEVVSSAFINTAGSDWDLMTQPQDTCWLGRSGFANDNDASASYNEVRIWNRALSDEELTANVLAGPDEDFYEEVYSQAQAIIKVNGETVLTAADTGVYEWTPTSNGVYTLEHRIMLGDEQLGETLTATFVAVGLNPEDPVITPASGSFIAGSSLSISMSCATEGATIYYTLDGSEPTMESTKYKRFKITGKTTVKARAFFENGNASEVVTAEYAFGQCAEPIIVSAGGTTFPHSGNKVTITAAQDGDEGYVADQVVRYTLDGSEPTAESAAYTGPFTIDETTTVKAKVFSDSFFDSAVATAELTREWVPVETPVIDAAEAFTGSKTKVAISCATAGAVIRYTLNGEDPNSDSKIYTGAFYVTSNCTVKAYAVLSDYTNSEIASKTIAKVWSIGDTMGKSDHAFATSGDQSFYRVDDETAPDGESMHSGAIGNEESSVLSTTVVGPGTLSFKWKASCEEDDEYEWDHAEFAVDGVVNARINGITDWIEVSVKIEGDCEHAITWTYLKDDVEYAGEDCIWVAAYVWASDYTATQTTATPVPYDWITEQLPETIDEFDVYESTAKGPAANPRYTVEECYIAGTDPADAKAEFTAKIEMNGDMPQVTPDPDLGAARKYTVKGKEKLGDAEWADAAEGHRFLALQA